MPNRKTMLGVVLGVAVGLLVESALVAKWRATILYFVVFSLGLVVILPLTAGIATATLLLRQSRREMNPSWPTLLLLAVVLWPVAVALPWGYAFLSVRQEARAAVPRYDRADAPQIVVRLGDEENYGDRVSFLFHTDADSLDVLRFYDAELAQRGWEPGPSHVVEHKDDGTPHWYQHQAKFLWLHIKFTPVSEHRLQFEVIYGL